MYAKSIKKIFVIDRVIEKFYIIKLQNLYQFFFYIFININLYCYLQSLFQVLLVSLVIFLKMHGIHASLDRVIYGTTINI